MTDILININTLLTIVCAVCIIIFIAIFSKVAWWKTAIGRNLVVCYSSIALYFISVPVLRYSEATWMKPIRTVALLAYAYGIIRRIYLLEQEQHRNGDEQ